MGRTSLLGGHLGRFPFNNNFGLTFHMPNHSLSPLLTMAQWNSTFRLHRPDPSHRTFGYCSCKQARKERYWKQNFVKWKGTLRSDRPKRPDRSLWTTIFIPKLSAWTKPKWSVQFDVPTKISGILGWMESALCAASRGVRIRESWQHFNMAAF